LAISGQQLGNYRNQPLKRGSKELRPRGDRAVEWHFAFCLQQNINSRVGFLAEGRRQKVAESPGSRDIGKVKALTTKDTKEHKGFLSLSLSLSLGILCDNELQLYLETATAF
jgi:hypothetical protein